MRQITPAQLAAWLAEADREKPLLLDVREPWEYQAARIDGSQPVPMREIPARVGELDSSRDLVAICHHGGRSMQVAMFLEKQGFTRVHNLVGGIDAWSRTVDPAVPLY
ncbi:MAG TPA: rhodanese-like domain-containing protein [Burkholderiales bacterium]|jgi:rhodanese-related sulfurtransferase|nr:rhodanese-like domain-containing protein [Burkholderiales bacterium]